MNCFEFYLGTIFIYRNFQVFVISFLQTRDYIVLME